MWGATTRPISNATSARASQRYAHPSWSGESKETCDIEVQKGALGAQGCEACVPGGIRGTAAGAAKEAVAGQASRWAHLAA